jgi:hypothetical protein
MRTVHANGRPAAAPLLLISTVVIIGCSADASAPRDPLPRVAVSGAVTLDGAPLPEGMIQFNPAPGTEGPPAAGEIRDGKFSIEKPQGPVPGQYKVTISSHPPARISEGQAPGGAPRRAPETVPARYNTESTLESDVPADGSSTLDFPLVKNPAGR